MDAAEAGALIERGTAMIRKGLIFVACLTLAGCASYGYRGGSGDYYYGSPGTVYRSYGAPYGSVGYGRYSGWYGGAGYGAPYYGSRPYGYGYGYGGGYYRPPPVIVRPIVPPRPGYGHGHGRPGYRPPHGHGPGRPGWSDGRPGVGRPDRPGRPDSDRPGRPGGHWGGRPGGDGRPGHNGPRPGYRPPSQARPPEQRPPSRPPQSRPPSSDTPRPAPRERAGYRRPDQRVP